MLSPLKSTAEQINQAVQLLNQDHVVGLPTETVYGLAARIDSRLGVERIFQVKKRPFFDPLIVHVNSIEMAKNYCAAWPALAEILAQAFWPGPLTLVIEKNAKVPDLVSSGLSTVGLRCPNSDIALSLITQIGVGLPAPSANLFSKTSPSRWQHVEQEFGDQVFCIQGPDCEIGIESTVLRIDKKRLQILRPGQISELQLSKVLTAQGLKNNLDFVWAEIESHTPLAKHSPGQLEQHYQPSKTFVLVGEKTSIVDWAVFLERQSLHREQTRELVLSKEPELAARELYHQLRVCSEPETIKLIYLRVTEPMVQTEWSAIMDRVYKASHLRLNL
jgi:L-threonylcarbamoyladenylate synthase